MKNLDPSVSACTYGSNLCEYTRRVGAVAEVLASGCGSCNCANGGTCNPITKECECAVETCVEAGPVSILAQGGTTDDSLAASVVADASACAAVALGVDKSVIPAACTGTATTIWASCTGTADEVAATCTGTASGTDSGMTCDLDAITDSVATCPAGCVPTATFVPDCDLLLATDNDAACPAGCLDTPQSTPTCDFDLDTDSTDLCPSGCLETPQTTLGSRADCERVMTDADPDPLTGVAACAYKPAYVGDSCEKECTREDACNSGGACNFHLKMCTCDWGWLGRWCDLQLLQGVIDCDLPRDDEYVTTVWDPAKGKCAKFTTCSNPVCDHGGRNRHIHYEEHFPWNPHPPSVFVQGDTHANCATFVPEDGSTCPSGCDFTPLIKEVLYVAPEPPYPAIPAAAAMCTGTCADPGICAAEVAEICAVDPCVGYVQGTLGVPSSTCPAGCTLAGDGRWPMGTSRDTTDDCMGTATGADLGKICDLDATTNGAPTCWIGCVFRTAPCTLTSGDADRDASTPGSCAARDVTTTTCAYVAGAYTPTCTGTATGADVGKICDLDLSTDGMDNCPIGCTYVHYVPDSCTSTLVPETCIATVSDCVTGYVPGVAAAAAICTGTATGADVGKVCDLAPTDSTSACPIGCSFTAATTPSTTCPIGCVQTDATFVHSPESCEIDPCTGYVQGILGVPSTSCSSGCTLAGDGPTDTCATTVDAGCSGANAAQSSGTCAAAGNNGAGGACTFTEARLATCTGTASGADVGKICDLDLSTDSMDTCPIGCVFTAAVATSTCVTTVVAACAGANAAQAACDSAAVFPGFCDDITASTEPACVALNPETCVVDACTGYVQGTTGVPSTTCPSACTLAGDGLGESCIATVADCGTGYVAGDATTPSTTCPAGCVLTNAAPGTWTADRPLCTFTPQESCTATVTDCATGYTAGDITTPSADCPAGCVLTQSSCPADCTDGGPGTVCSGDLSESRCALTEVGGVVGGLASDCDTAGGCTYTGATDGVTLCDLDVMTDNSKVCVAGCVYTPEELYTPAVAAIDEVLYVAPVAEFCVPTDGTRVARGLSDTCTGTSTVVATCPGTCADSNNGCTAAAACSDIAAFVLSPVVANCPASSGCSFTDVPACDLDFITDSNALCPAGCLETSREISELSRGVPVGDDHCEYVTGRCVQGDMNTLGMDSEFANCLQPQTPDDYVVFQAPGEWVTDRCVPGDMHTLGTDTVLEDCQIRETPMQETRLREHGSGNDGPVSHFIS